MDLAARTHVLARQLSAALAMSARYADDRAYDRGDRSRLAAGFLTDCDRVAAAVDVELAELFRHTPALAALVEEMKGHADRRRLVDQVDLALRELPHTRAALLALTQSATEPVTDGSLVRRARRWSRSARWLGHTMILVWMNLLFAVPIAFAFLTVWGGFERQYYAADISGLLKAFLVWVLSFLPSWLYIRFLRQRASALWNEYVIHLHRLAVDEPRYLPKPPKASEFYREWLDDDGFLLDEEQNIYRQKFNAYYGRAVSSPSGSDFAVKTETLFPVFLATTVFATCWTAILWDTSFIENPITVWDFLKFGFLGAYVFTLQSLVRRFFQSDLRPSAYASALLRIIVVFTVLAPLYQLVYRFGPSVQAVVAFVVGVFPIAGIYALHRAAAVTLRHAVPQLTPEYPLNRIDGLNVWYESRLIEEGIEDMQSLVTANLVDVILHTRVPLGRLVDWIDQAQLYLHLDDGESARGEESSEQPSHSHAGTDTRVALRQLGIRTATDLLIAFPPGQIDPGTPTQLAGRRFDNLAPADIDLDRVRTLVRVLDKNTDLVAVWNWQRRGARIRAPQPPPSSGLRDTA
ncbi:hypothetical protein [Nocardia arizonensis]|uniref:hypothetical protein n=1 Tax=Nocardia arizonensis TaxID=1141647 RepID=UPI0006CF5A5B|nr:hypothetical protein [Nocardia arizonensis]